MFIHVYIKDITPSEIGLDLLSPLDLGFILKAHLPPPKVSPIALSL